MLRFTVLSLLLIASKAQFNPNCAEGRKGQVLVHLFSWQWVDVAEECEHFLGPNGFCGIQVSPPNEHVIIRNPIRPWWEVYQPISYQLESRFGTRSQFIDMVQRCNAAGVRIYIDAVINHMAAFSSGRGLGSGGSYYNTLEMSFPGVPYGPQDFEKECTTDDLNIDDVTNKNQMRNCRLLGLLDLDASQLSVRSRIAAYFDDMLTIGIDGYRIDAAKHMWADELEAILKQAKNSSYGRPFVYQEVIDLGDDNQPIRSADYQHLGQVTEFIYGVKMNEIFSLDTTYLAELKSIGKPWGMLNASKALVFIDNHDNQRGHGAGNKVLTHEQPEDYKLASIFMLSWPYGTPRVMSSYTFEEDWTGPPSTSPGAQESCEEGWVCEHRWREIRNMVAWRNTAGKVPLANWWTNGKNQIAFSRADVAFIVFNKKDGALKETLQTGLPEGRYCDVISGDILKGKCGGGTINVSSDGNADIHLSGDEDIPAIAIHIGAAL